MEMIDLKKILLKENIFTLCRNKNDDNLRANGSFTRQHPEFIEAKNFILNLLGNNGVIDPEITRTVEEVRSLGELCYLVKNNIKEIPRCPICGKLSTFSPNVPIKRKEDAAYNFWPDKYHVTCGERACYNQIAAQTNLNRYGSYNSSSNELTKEKIRQTNLKKYGVPYSSQAEIVKEKAKQTNLKKYGAPSNMQTVEFKEKSRQTMYEKYGDLYVRTPAFRKKVKEAWASKTEEEKSSLRDKIEKTNLEKYGTKTPLLNSDCIEKTKQTCLEKYGSETYFGSEVSKEVLSKIVEENHNSNNYEKTLELARKSKSYYRYGGENFDSSWELAFYIYHKDHNLSIIRTPISLEYEYGGHLHFYRPDFEINGELIEIKGNQFFDKEGNFVPHPRAANDCKTEEDLKLLYEKSKSLYNCMLENHVKILREEDIKFYLDYIKNKYGLSYLKNFKNKKEANV